MKPVTAREEAVVDQMRDAFGSTTNWMFLDGRAKDRWVRLARWHLKKIREARKERK